MRRATMKPLSPLLGGAAASFWWLRHCTTLQGGNGGGSAADVRGSYQRRLRKSNRDQNDTASDLRIPGFPESSPEGTPVSGGGATKAKETCSLADNCDVFHFTAASGMTWVDIRGRQGDDDAITTDADFVVAVRSILAKNNVPGSLMMELRNQFALPQIIRHSDKSFCIVCRFSLSACGSEMASSSPLLQQPEEGPRAVAAATSATTTTTTAATLGSPYRKVGISMTSASLSGASPRNAIHERLLQEFDEAHDTTHGERAALDASRSLYEMTGRLTIIVLKKHNKLITVHRQRIPAMVQLRRHWNDQHKHKSMDDLVLTMMRSCAMTFLDSAREIHFAVDVLEEMLFEDKKSSFRERGLAIMKLHGLNRGASVYCRMLKPMDRTLREVLRELDVPEKAPRSVDALQATSRALHSCEELREQIISLLSLHFSVVSYKIEDLMRVMTVFSTLFAPLMFATSLLGMNFDGMVAFMQRESGMVVCMIGLVLSGATTLLWLQRRKFL